MWIVVLGDHCLHRFGYLTRVKLHFVLCVVRMLLAVWSEKMILQWHWRTNRVEWLIHFNAKSLIIMPKQKRKKRQGKSMRIYEPHKKKRSTHLHRPLSENSGKFFSYTRSSQCVLVGISTHIPMPINFNSGIIQKRKIRFFSFFCFFSPLNFHFTSSIHLLLLLCAPPSAANKQQQWLTATTTTTCTKIDAKCVWAKLFYEFVTKLAFFLLLFRSSLSYFDNSIILLWWTSTKSNNTTSGTIFRFSK